MAILIDPPTTVPVIVFIDTPGAYPGIGAEERGQAEAIAVNLDGARPAVVTRGE